MVALRDEVARQLKEDMDLVPQESPVDDHAANGNAELGVRELKRQIRAVRFAVEAKFRRQLPADSPLIAWIPRHAAMLL